MTTTVRSAFDTWPGLQESIVFIAGIDFGLGRSLAGGVANCTVDAMVVDGVAGAEGIGVISKRPISYAAVFCAPVAPEAVDRIEDYGRGESSGFIRLIPVPEFVDQLERSAAFKEKTSTHG